MNDLTIEQMHKFEETFWWHVGKTNLVHTTINHHFKEFPITMLEIGCGSGSITKSLTKYGEVYGNDLSKKALEFCKSRGVANLIHGDITTLDMHQHENKFDLVLALDVLEHIQDDVAAIQTVHKLLKDDGMFLVNVPAYKFLWSSHDEALMHKRRYTTFEIARKLEDNGFKILHKSHFVFFAFFGIAPIKFLGNFFKKTAYPETSYVELPKSINNFMIKLLNFEAKLAQKLRLPLGTTITVVAKKV